MFDIFNKLSIYLSLYRILTFQRSCFEMRYRGGKDNNKYLVAYTHHFRERFTFSAFFLFFFFFLRLFLGNLRHEAQVHSYSATSCEYDNVEVNEKSIMCHAS